MRVSHLSLSNFRNYGVAEVSFQPGLNLIIGRNGQGKTNLVEAISYFATLGSHRVSSEAALIRSGCESAVARMKVSVEQRTVLLEMQLNRDKPNRAQVSRNAVKPREVTRWVSSVLFAPEDLSLVRGDPSTRRRFLDEAVVSRNPVFSGVLSDYDRVVRQRTALLKSARSHASRAVAETTLDLWDSQLIELGTTIMLARRSLAIALEDPLRTSYAAIVQHDHQPRMRITESVTQVLVKLDVSRETPKRLSADAMNLEPIPFETSPSARELIPVVDVSRETLVREFRTALSSVRQQEFDRGVTLIGPHRDDAFFELNNLPVKGYASHGESWSFALALKLAIASLLRDELPSGDPVIILDDVFAELDVHRRTALMSEVKKFEQVIVTAAVEQDLPEGEWHRIRVHAGSVLEGEAADD